MFLEFGFVLFSLLVGAVVIVVIEVGRYPRASDVSEASVFGIFELEDKRLPKISFGDGGAGYLHERFVVFVHYGVDGVDD